MKCATTDATILECLGMLDENKGIGVPIIDKEGRMQAYLTDGDIRRALIKGADLSVNCMKAANKNFYYVHNIEQINKKNIVDYVCIPILTKEMKIVRFIVEKEEESRSNSKKVAGFIAAGGKGTRLRPITKEIPKPLVDLNGETLLERIIKQFKEAGIEDIYVSVNYMADKIQKTIGDGKKWGVKMIYIKEESPLGTAGSISLIQNFRHDELLVTNGDIYTELDYSRLMRYHKMNNKDVTVSTINHTITVPFGVIQRESDRICGIIEKPSYSFQCNAGIYIISKKILELIPKNEYYDMPDLVKKAIKEGYQAGLYQIEDYWADIGTVPDLDQNRRMLKLLELIKKEK